MAFLSTENLTTLGVRSSVGKLLIAGWVALMSVVVTTLMAGHWLILPHPPVGEKVSWEGATDDVALTAYHFLYVDCPCSRRILDRFPLRSVVAGVTEQVVLVQESANCEQGLVDRLEAQGFKVATVTPPQLKQQFGIESAPLLVVVDRSGEIVYSGGYTFRKQGQVIQDDAVLETLARGDEIESLPVFGCAVSNDLKRLTDPLGIKYSRSPEEDAGD